MILLENLFKGLAEPFTTKEETRNTIDALEKIKEKEEKRKQQEKKNNILDWRTYYDEKNYGKYGTDVSSSGAAATGNDEPKENSAAMMVLIFLVVAFFSLLRR